MIQIDLDKLVPIQDLPGKLDQIVDEAHEGAIFVVTKDDRPAVAIVAVDQLEGLSGRKVVTPMNGTSAEPPPPSPSPEESVSPATVPPAEPLPAPDIQPPTTSVQRDLTPGLPEPGAAPPPPPPSGLPGPTGQGKGASPTPPADPDKPLDEMPL